jgi:hypothetical protein
MCDRGMPPSGKLRRVALVIIDVSEVFLRGVVMLLVAANVVLTSLIFFPLTVEAISSYETSILTRATQRNIPEG